MKELRSEVGYLPEERPSWIRADPLRHPAGHRHVPRHRHRGAGHRLPGVHHHLRQRPGHAVLHPDHRAERSPSTTAPALPISRPSPACARPRALPKVDGILPTEAIQYAQFGIILSGFVSIAAGLLVRFFGTQGGGDHPAGLHHRPGGHDHRPDAGGQRPLRRHPERHGGCHGRDRGLDRRGAGDARCPPSSIPATSRAFWGSCRCCWAR